MKRKKINSKGQTNELRRAAWEFLKRNPEALKVFEEQNSYVKKWHEKQARSDSLLSSPDYDEHMKGISHRPAAENGNLILRHSWTRTFVHKIKKKSFPKHPLFFSPLENIPDDILVQSLCAPTMPDPAAEEEETRLYREQILRDAKGILDRMVFPDPRQSLILIIDLERSKEAILSEVNEIVSKEQINYHERKNTEWISDENGTFLDKIYNNRKDRLKWLSTVDELLQVWDLYDTAGKQPWKRTFKQISRTVGRAVSTVKDQWREARKKIYPDFVEEYTAESATDRQRKADELCVQCPYGGASGKRPTCYEQSGAWIPCTDYLKIAGSDRSSFVEAFAYNDEIDYSKNQPLHPFKKKNNTE